MRLHKKVSASIAHSALKLLSLLPLLTLLHSVALAPVVPPLPFVSPIHVLASLLWAPWWSKAQAPRAEEAVSELGEPASISTAWVLEMGSLLMKMLSHLTLSLPASLLLALM